MVMVRLISRDPRHAYTHAGPVRFQEVGLARDKDAHWNNKAISDKAALAEECWSYI